jgi:hypothetical protein
MADLHREEARTDAALSLSAFAGGCQAKVLTNIVKADKVGKTFASDE